MSVHNKQIQDKIKALLIANGIKGNVKLYAGAHFADDIKVMVNNEYYGTYSILKHTFIRYADEK